MKIEVALQRALLCLIFLAALLPGKAQTPRTTVTGIVRAENGDPLANVTVTIKNVHTNFSAGTATDSMGLFHFAGLEAGSGYEFSFSSIGFQTQTVSNNTLKPGSVFSLAIHMVEASKALNEVVVVGYGTQLKTATTAAISEVKGAQLAESPVPNITGSLAGNVSGIIARPNGGVPGQDDPEIHIRGVATTGTNNGALIVIDGIIRSNINEIDPNSIASVTILKDAAAVAPYGVGGANGVILITTKRGKAGTANLSINSYYGFQRPTFPPKMLNAVDYMKLMNEADANSGLQPAYSTNFIQNYPQLHARNPNAYPASNAQQELIRLNTPQQNYNLQVSGGSDKLQYYVGLNYFGQAGNAQPLYYNRYSYNMALDIKATATTKVTVSLSGAQEVNQIYPNVAGSFISYVPTQAVYYTNGLWGQSGGSSPAGQLHSGSFDRINLSTMLSQVGIEQQLPFIKGLSIKGVFAYDPTDKLEKIWNKPTYNYNYDSTANSYTQNLLTDGYTTLSDSDNRNANYTYQGYINYHNSFGKSSVTGLIVAEARNNITSNFWASRKGFSVNIPVLDLGTSDRDNFNNGGSGATGSQVGYVYRADYAYDSKYLLEATGRYDGQYYFAPGKRWGFFPAFSAGWRLSEESFIKDHVDWIDQLKLRGSWGESGNLAGQPYQYLNSYTLDQNPDYAFGSGTLVQGSYVNLEANPNITWERSKKTDIGLDGDLWRGALTFQLDWFYEKRSNMLVTPSITVPVEYGLALAQENAGVMSNQGFEAVLGTQHTFHNGLRLGFNGNFTFAKNKLIQVFETAATYDNPNRRRTGKPYNTPFGYKALGLFKTSDDKNGDGVIDGSDGYNVTQFGTLHPGDVKYADLNHDGVIDDNDETKVGYPSVPQITYGFTATGNWKGFDVSLFFEGAAEASINIAGYQTIPFRLNNTNAGYEYYNNRWTPEHQDARFPRAYASLNTNNTTNPTYGNTFGPWESSEWMSNSGFLRLKTAMIGYTIPAHFTRRLKMQNLRFYATAQNLFTFSHLLFEDPETGYTAREEAYPVQKTIIFGLNLNF